MLVGSDSRARPLEDGAGLCSPGRWHPRDRCLPVKSVAFALGRKLADECNSLFHDGSLLARAASGKLSADPFPPAKTSELRWWIKERLTERGLNTEDRPNDQRQLIGVRLLQALLKDAGDPDWEVLDQYARGVRVGVGVRMPRTPAVFNPKRKWRLPGQEEVQGRGTGG